MKNIEENNRLIAGFENKEVKIVGGILCFVGDNKSPFDLVEYHKSWSLLMPVVEKIAIIERKFKISACYYDSDNLEDVDFTAKAGVVRGHSLSHESLRDAVYKEVVEFIKWYNNNK